MTVLDWVVGVLLVASVVAVVGIVSDNGFLIEATGVILGVGFFGLMGVAGIAQDFRLAGVHIDQGSLAHAQRLIRRLSAEFGRKSHGNSEDGGDRAHLPTIIPHFRSRIAGEHKLFALSSLK